MRKSTFPRTRRRGLTLIASLSLAALAVSGCAGGTDPAPSDPGPSSAPGDKTYEVAYMAFAVANSFLAPMLASAQAIAAENNIKLTVFDAANDAQAQYSQLQDVITSGKYDGIITQPIFGVGLMELVEEAIGKGIKVVNINQILGPDMNTAEPQIEGLTATVATAATTIGGALGSQARAACESENINPCNVGYLFNIKVSAFDLAVRASFDAAIAESALDIRIVAEGEAYFTATVGLAAVQDMLQAHSDLDVIAGADQGIQGATQALEAAGRMGDVLLVSFGGSAVGIQSVANGTWFSTVMQAPATEGRLGMQAMVKALREGVDSGWVDAREGMPNNGIVTRDTASQFTAEWPG